VVDDDSVALPRREGGSGWGGGYGGSGGYGASRFDEMAAFGSSYGTPGWQRAQARRGQQRGSFGFDEGLSRYDASEDRNAARGPRGFSTRGQAGPSGVRRMPLTIEGELVAKSTGTASEYATGDRVFHQKFGYGRVSHVDGNKLTIQFDKAGEKRVVDSFVQRA